MKSLQEITDAWGNWYSSQHGTSCRFTSSTNYSDHGELGQYHQYQVGTTVLGIQYSGNNPPTNGSTVAYELWYDNGTDVTQTNTFSQTKATEQTFQWSVTESLSVGVEVSATVGLPGEVSVSSKLTVSLGLSSTQGQTSSTSQSWTVDSPINVPAHSSVKADMVISTQSYNTSFTEQVSLAGSVAIWNNDKVNGHWLWFIPIQSVFNDCVNNNLIDTSGYQIQAGDVLATATGVFTGGQGISVGVTANQYPLRNANTKEVAQVSTPHQPSSLLAVPAK